MPQDRKTYGHIEHIDDSRAKVPLACIEENNFFPKTFGSITEKVYLCMQSLIIRRLNMNIEEKKADFMRRFKASRERKAEYIAQMEKRMREDYRRRTGKEAESFCVL
jgi:hypothetical protein|nr:hypothetical protein [uncultured Prevotella sp.]